MKNFFSAIKNRSWKFPLPVVVCDHCGGDLVLSVSPKLKSNFPTFNVICVACGEPIDLGIKSSLIIENSKANIRRTSKMIAKSLLELRRSVPKDKADYVRIIRDPRHPFTAALLTGLALLLMEMSGFGVFLAVAWILGNLVLNPLGWVLIPIVVAIAVANRRVFSKQSFLRIRDEINELQKKYDAKEISEGEFELAREKILAQAFDKDSLEDVLSEGEFDSDWIDRIRNNSEKQKPEWIWDKEHSSALKQAINDSESGLFIYSGWINNGVLKEIQRETLSALNRGTKIFIGYGWESPSGRSQQTKWESDALKLLQKIKERSNNPNFLVWKRFPNHSKLLVCDDKYVICGSANWLSNVGYHNREVSIRLRDPQLVSEFISEVSVDFS